MLLVARPTVGQRGTRNNRCLHTLFFVMAVLPGRQHTQVDQRGPYALFPFVLCPEVAPIISSSRFNRRRVETIPEALFARGTLCPIDARRLRAIVGIINSAP
uniref:Secreted protein n=1 Tax=Steinernema glaseri TaxID=37863 RepID=A0A1I7XX82_9BILA